MRSIVLGLALLATLPTAALATGDEEVTIPRVDAAPCDAAVVANDDDRIIAACGALIENDRTERGDRLKALIARAKVFVRRDQVDRAIADEDAALRIDPAQADLFNSRGELWWKKGDRPKALADFAAALKLNPEHPAAKANYRNLAQELERIGAEMALAGKPSFNCRMARRPVERAICANPELANLDRAIAAASARVVREAKSASEARRLRQAQDDFITRRNAQFGRAGYDLKKEMEDRLQALTGAVGH